MSELKRGIFLYSSFFLACTFFSCNSSRDIEIGKNKTFRLHSKERNIPLSSFIKSDYDDIIGSLHLNLPLNKYIKSESSEIYAGIAIDNSIDSLNARLQRDPSISIINNQLVNGCQTSFSKKKGKFFISTIIPDEYPILILCVGNDSVKIQNLYTKDEIINRVY